MKVMGQVIAKAKALVILNLVQVPPAAHNLTRSRNKSRMTEYPLHEDRHCEERSDAAIQCVYPPSSAIAALDWLTFGRLRPAALAMTADDPNPEAG